ncbi:hypothetical protein T11_8002, partial [Trichinella zimbabwensis]
LVWRRRGGVCCWKTAESGRKREKILWRKISLSWTKNGGVVQRKTALGRTKSVPSSWLENGTES